MSNRIIFDKQTDKQNPFVFFRYSFLRLTEAQAARAVIPFRFRALEKMI